MDSIIVGFSRPKGWFEPFSWIIRLATWSSYSHAYIKYYNVYSDRWIVFQASGLKTNFIGQTLFDSNEIIVKEFEIEIVPEERIKIIQFAIDNCGKPYGVVEILGIGCVLFMRMFGKQIKNPFRNQSTFFCSEIVEIILNQILKEGDELPPSCSTPKDLYQFLESKNLKVITAQST